MSMLSPVFSAPLTQQMLRDPVPSAKGAPLKPVRCCAETEREEPRSLLRAMHKHHFLMEIDIRCAETPPACRKSACACCTWYSKDW